MFVFWGSVLRPSWSLLSSILPCKCLSYCLSDTNIILCHLSASSQPPPWKWHLLIPNVTQYKNQELPSVQAGFRKGWGSRDHIANIRGSQKKQQDSRKTSTSASLTTIKLFDWVDHNKLWNSLKEMGIPGYLTCLLRNLYADQEATVTTEQPTGSKLGKESVKAVYCHPAYLTYMQSTSWEMPGWMKLESRFPGKYQ